MESTADIQVGDVVAPRAAVSIEITSTPVLSYALAHNRVPVVSRLAHHQLRRPGARPRRCGSASATPRARSPATVELLADLDEGRTTVLTDLGLVMDPAAMLHVEEQRPGVIDVEVESDGELLGEGSRVVQVLAAQQWLATPLPLALEMLAAHVMPNHPAVTALVARRPACSRSETGSGSIDGYAARPRAGRRDRRGDRRRHAAPRHPLQRAARVSWSDLGQQVRSPGDVLTWRVGTPLDTVVVLAAALEQAGIRPLLWLADGHAFLGYWREERSAESAATTDAAPLVNLVDLGLIGLVETTLLTSMGEPGADLHRPAYTGWLTGELDRILGVTDVHRARRDGIFPLPARARDADGVLQVVEYRPALHSAAGDGRARRRRRPRTAARGAAAGAAVEERAARPQPAQPADQLHRALRAGRWPCPARALGALENFVHDGTPITLLPADQLAAVQKERGHRHRPRAARGAARPSCWSSAARCTPTSPPAATCRGCATSPTRRRRCSRRPAPTTSTWRSAAWSGSSTAARCARRWCSSRSSSAPLGRTGSYRLDARRGRRRARRTTACWRSCASCTASSSRR